MPTQTLVNTMIRQVDSLGLTNLTNIPQNKNGANLTNLFGYFGINGIDSSGATNFTKIYIYIYEILVHVLVRE